MMEVNSKPRLTVVYPATNDESIKIIKADREAAFLQTQKPLCGINGEMEGGGIKLRVNFEEKQEVQQSLGSFGMLLSC